MKPKQEGPFTITEVLGPVMYRLQLPSSWQIHNVFHAILLWPYQENEVYGMNFTKPPPESIKGDKVYKVESILKHWKQGCSYQYYIKWKGYPISDALQELEHVGSIHHLWLLSHLATSMFPFDQIYNMEQEFYQCLEHVYEILDFLEDIKIILEQNQGLTILLQPPFWSPSFHLTRTINMSSSSSSSSTHFVDTLELGHIVLDNLMTDLINQLFQSNEGSSAYLRYYHHITWNIQWLEHKLNQLWQEQWNIHEHLMSSSHFKWILQPIIQTHHIHSRQSSFHPYANWPLSWQKSTDSPPFFVGISMGNPGVCRANLYPYPWNHLPMVTGRGFHG